MEPSPSLPDLTAGLSEAETALVTHDALLRFVLEHNLVSKQLALKAAAKVQDLMRLGGLAYSLLDELGKLPGLSPTDFTLKLLEASNLPFCPVDQYEPNPELVQALPPDLTLGRLMVPFDLLTPVILVALVNPFDEAGKTALTAAFAKTHPGHSLCWHLAEPEALTKVLKALYRL